MRATRRTEATLPPAFWRRSLVFGTSCERQLPSLLYLCRVHTVSASSASTQRLSTPTITCTFPERRRELEPSPLGGPGASSSLRAEQARESCLENPGSAHEIVTSLTFYRHRSVAINNEEAPERPRSFLTRFQEGARAQGLLEAKLHFVEWRC